MIRPLGRVVEHDERSRLYPFQATAAPHTVLWEHTAPVLDQGELSSCTGNALAQWLNCAVNAGHRGTYLSEADALEVYALATQLDAFPGSWPPQDTGSSGLAACKAGQRMAYLSGYRHVFDVASFCATLAHSPVIAGTAWYASMFEPGADGVLSPSGAVAGGHEYLILGIDMETQFVTLLNSWGPSWGDNGRAKLKLADFTALVADQGDITVPIL